jgi:uncharacterized protein (TIGR02246 family)
MQDDEQAIRDLVMNWQSAAAAGDLARLLTMMAEDVVFLTLGQPPMRGRDAFAKNFRAAVEHFRIESSCQILEVRIVADWAYCWNQLSVTLTPRQAGPTQRRTGYTLTILRKEPNNAWVLFRDANLLSPEP